MARYQPMTGRVGIVVQARMSSRRLPGKVMKTLAGAPAILRLMERVQRIRRADVAVVATSEDSRDDPLAEVCVAAGHTVVRGPLDDVLARYRQAAPADCEVVVRLTGDCPLIDPAVVDDHIETFLKGQPWAEYVSNAAMRTMPVGLDTEVVSRAMLLRADAQATSRYDREHVLPWVRRRARTLAVAQETDLSALRWTLDTEADYAFIAAVYEALYPDKPAFDSDDVYRLLLRRPELIHAGPDSPPREALVAAIEAHLAREASSTDAAAAGPRFLPYGRQVVEQDDIDAVVEVLKSDFLTTGPTVQAFESALADVAGAQHAVAVSSGTAALHAACFAAGVGPGDTIVVPAVSFLATANCGVYLGAEPIFVDVDPDTGLIQPSEVARVCAERNDVKAVLPVDLTGAPVDLAAVKAAAGAAKVIVDAAHGLGGHRGDGQAIGACAHANMAIFSFHPVKHVTTGEGGAVTCDDPDLLRSLQLFRNHGMERADEHLQFPKPGPWYYEQQVLGHNLRLSDIHASLGLSQLGKLTRFVDRRRALARQYDALLAEVPWIKPVAPELRGLSAHHLYAVLIDFDAIGMDRAALMMALRERGIGTQVHYIPIPMQPYYRARGWDVQRFPGAVRYYDRTLSLPLFPSMADADVDRVVQALRAVVESCGR